jgi:hypothetical protein
MPKKMNRNKRGSSRIRNATPKRAARIHSVKDLLVQKSPLMTRVTQQAMRQNHWEKWLSSHLPGELAAHLSGISDQPAALVIFADSAAWSARLRYAVAELEGQMRALDAKLGAIQVRVLPRS